LLAAAHVLLGGVFFLCFVLGRHAHFPWAVGAMAVVVLAYMVAVAELPAGLRPDGVVALFLGATTVLILLLLGAFAGSSRQVHSYLW
jgi:hypothetical protein